MKKLLAIVLILAMSLALLPMSAMAATGPVKVGDTEYATFAAALTAVPDGGTIDLVVDTNVPANTTISKPVTINTNGYELKFDRRLIISGVNVTIDGDIIVVGTSADDGVIDQLLFLDYSSKLNVTGNVTLTRGGIWVQGTYGFPQWESKLTVGGDVFAEYGIVLSQASMEVGGNVTINGFLWGAGIAVEGGTLTIEGNINLFNELEDPENFPYFRLGDKFSAGYARFIYNLNPGTVGGFDADIADGYYIASYTWVMTSVVKLAVKHICEEFIDDPDGEGYVAAVCEEPGFMPTKCSECGEPGEGYVLPALGHAYDVEVTPPTCLEDGFTTFTCSRCADEYVGDEVPALGHSWDRGLITIKPTAHAEGLKIFTCKACGETYSVVLPKLNVDGLTADAYVEFINGNMNYLTITVTELVSREGSSKQSEVFYTETFLIKNNAAGEYDVGPYTVYVNTKGNTQIREIYVVG